MTTITEQQRLTMVRLRNEGYFLNEIAQAIGCSDTAVTKHLRIAAARGIQVDHSKANARNTAMRKRMMTDLQPDWHYSLDEVAPRLEQWFRAGLPYSTMATRLNLDERNVRRWLTIMGLIRPHKVQAQHIDRMVALRNKGHYYREIAHQLGFSERTVRDYIRHRHDVDHRDAIARAKTDALKNLDYIFVKRR